MSETTPLVHVVDDDGAYLSALSRFLRAAGFTVRKYTSVAEFLASHEAEAPGCVVADLRMPGASGLDLQAALATEPEPLPVVLLTGQGDIPSSVRAMKLGAVDFITKKAPKEDLLAAIQDALARDAEARESRARKRELKRLVGQLTPREREVLSLVVQGKMNKEIADELGIHERTVKLHRTGVTTKLGVQSVAQLTRLVLEAGIIP